MAKAVGARRSTDESQCVFRWGGILPKASLFRCTYWLLTVSVVQNGLFFQEMIDCVSIVILASKHGFPNDGPFLTTHTQEGDAARHHHENPAPRASQVRRERDAH